MRSRDCDTYEKLVDTIIADRLKDSLSPQCLEYCLSIEGNKVLPSDELAALADTFDANYTPEGRYRESTVSTFKDSRPGTNGSTNQTQRRPIANSMPAMVTGVQSQARGTPAAGVGLGRGREGAQQQQQQQQRKCFACGSSAHLLANCPLAREGQRQNRNQSERANACVVSDLHNQNSAGSLEEATAIMQVQVNRAAIAPRDVHSSVAKSPVVKRVGDDDDRRKVTPVCTSPLTYIPLYVGGNGPYKCLVDSGSELPIAKRVVVENLMPQAESTGHIRLQGIFGEPVPADLVSLPVSVRQNTNVEQQQANIVMPIVFAVTYAMVQDCDFVLPTDMLQVVRSQPDADEPDKAVTAVVTRSQSQRAAASGDQLGTANVSPPLEPIPAPSARVEHGDDITDNVDYPDASFVNKTDHETLIEEQRNDATLDPCWRMALQGKRGMFVENGLLYHWDLVCGHEVKQVCVPHGRHVQVMRLAHEAITVGHLRGQKTSERIRLNFYWPSLKQDVFSFTASCQPCQLRARTKKTDRVPISPMIRPTLPFIVCHADVIGPIEPPSAKGHKWALWVIGDCTRWPAVYLLRSLTA